MSRRTRLDKNTRTLLRGSDRCEHIPRSGEHTRHHLYGRTHRCNHARLRIWELTYTRDPVFIKDVTPGTLTAEPSVQVRTGVAARVGRALISISTSPAISSQLKPLSAGAGVAPLEVDAIVSAATIS